MISDDMTFDEWFEAFEAKLREEGFTGELDKYAFESEYEIEGKTPEAAANDFLYEGSGE